MDNIAKVFVSYSRKNKEFAEFIVAEIGKDGRDIWVDWEDIPRGADWLQEIFSGIDNADTFLFLVSEHSLVSEVCNQELAYALSNNKKVIPVILQDIDDALYPQLETQWKASNIYEQAHQNWDALRHINWVFFNKSINYRAEIDALRKTIDEDLDHIKTHTRLLIRAQEWVKANNNPSSLLSGDEIVAAEEWLRNYANTEPLPTETHSSYIQSSRIAENERVARQKSLETSSRRRLQVLVVSFVLIILVIVVGLLPRINILLGNQLADEIDFRLSEAAFAFEDLLDEDEELAEASARFVANLLEVQRFREIDGEELDRELNEVRTDFRLQEISIYPWGFTDSSDIVYYLGPEINHNTRVQDARENIIRQALETRDAASAVVIGSPESQIIAAEPIYDIPNQNPDQIIGVALVAFHLNDEYVQDLAVLLNIEAILTNLEEQIVATTLTLGEDLDMTATNELNTLASRDYEYEDADNARYFNFTFQTGDARVINIPLNFGNDDEEVGFLFVIGSFESVLDLQGDIRNTIFFFTGAIIMVVLVLLLGLIGIPYIRDRRLYREASAIQAPK